MSRLAERISGVELGSWSWAINLGISFAHNVGANFDPEGISDTTVLSAWGKDEEDEESILLMSVIQLAPDPASNQIEVSTQSS